MRMRKGFMAAAIMGSMLLGGAVGATVFSAAAGNASTSNSSSSGTAATAGQARFHSNGDPAHEATESAAREAQENAGQFPTVP